MDSRIVRLGGMLALAVVYALSGKAGLLLAIPPGYATAVWPPSGIAAAALLLGGLWLWPGVLLGSVIVNLWTSGDFSSTDSLLRSLMIASGIGAGAALQAILATSLVRMSVPHLNIFRLESNVVRLLVMAGPVACVVNATIGVSTLFIAGLLPAESFLFNWWTWWIGDSIGVLVFLPLILIWNQRPYSVWYNRQITVSAPTVLIFVAVVCLFFFASAREDKRIRAEFGNLVSHSADGFAQRLAETNAALASVAAYLEAAPQAGPEGFRRFTQPLLDANTALDQFQYLDDNGVTGGPLQARYLAPSIPGLAASSAQQQVDAQTLAAAAAARQLARPVSFVSVVSEGDRPSARLRTVMPVGAEGEAGPRGYVVGSVQTDEIAWKTFQPLDGIGFELDFSEAGGRRSWLLDQRAKAGGEEAFQVDSTIKQGGGELHLRFHVVPAYFVEHRSWQAWGLLAIGLIFTALLCVVMLVLIGREARVEEIVAEKTQQLSRERHQLNNLMASFPDPHFVVDEAGLVIEINEAARRQLGLAREQVLRRPVQDFFEGELMAQIAGQLDSLDGAAGAGRLRAATGVVAVTLHANTFRSGDTPLIAITARLV